ncbi:hypothetical protein OCU04_003662 [Sclerotinia nivalis]|uniref:SRR1-like domain-containing protein n=1 Tax=Sclerotinia nivalis TaxID=352851 RepID=A0A9X0DPI3_9HELO|nr:hypothetical protein OCU04_003662 [Sclerotinia nivalis]
MATSNTHLYPQVGLKNPDPVDTIIQTPLHYETLKEMKSEDRNKSIVGRANFFGQLTFLPFALDLGSCDAAMSKARLMVKDGNVGKNPQNPALRMPVNALKAACPLTPEIREKGERFWKRRENAYPNADALDEAFTEAIVHFKQTKLCDRLKTSFTKKLCEDKKFDKIVAFGGNTLGHEQQSHSIQGVKMFTQHAALLSIRDNWIDSNKGRTKDDFKIYLQDPLYNKNDLEVAKRHGMTIVCGDMSHQMGWILIDCNTLVVDLDTPREIMLQRLVFEISRPAGFLICNPSAKYKAGKIEKELETFTDPPSPMERLFAYTLANNDIRVPYYGLSEPIFKDWAKEYELKDLDKDGLVVGVAPPSRKPSTKAEADGENGRCYLGSTGPILLRRST